MLINTCRCYFRLIVAFHGKWCYLLSLVGKRQQCIENKKGFQTFFQTDQKVHLIDTHKMKKHGLSKACQTVGTNLPDSWCRGIIMYNGCDDPVTIMFSGMAHFHRKEYLVR